MKKNGGFFCNSTSSPSRRGSEGTALPGRSRRRASLSDPKKQVNLELGKKSEKERKNPHRVEVRPKDLHAGPRLLPRFPGRPLGGGLSELQVPCGQGPRALPGLDRSLAQEHPRRPPQAAAPPAAAAPAATAPACREGVVDVRDDSSDHKQGVGVRYRAAADAAVARRRRERGGGGSRDRKRGPRAADARVPPPPLEPLDRQLPAALGAPLLRCPHGRGRFPPGGRGGRVAEARVEEAPAAGAAVKGERRSRLGGRGAHRCECDAAATGAAPDHAINCSRWRLSRQP